MLPVEKSHINLHYSYRFECSAWLMLLCVFKYVYCERKVSGGQAVMKSRGPGIFPGYYECGPGYFYWKIQSNLFNTDTKGTKPSVRFTEVSVL